MAEDSNGRVTMAILNTKLDNVISRLDEFKTNHIDHEKRLSRLEQTSERRSEEIENLEDDVKNLKTRGFLGDGIAAVLAVIAGLIGWLKP